MTQLSGRDRFCGACAQEFDKSDKFCTNCGAPRRDAPRTAMAGLSENASESTGGAWSTPRGRARRGWRMVPAIAGALIVVAAWGLLRLTEQDEDVSSGARPTTAEAPSTTRTVVTEAQTTSTSRTSTTSTAIVQTTSTEPTTTTATTVATTVPASASTMRTTTSTSPPLDEVMQFFVRGIDLEDRTVAAFEAGMGEVDWDWGPLIALRSEHEAMANEAEQMRSRASATYYLDLLIEYLRNCGRGIDEQDYPLAVNFCRPMFRLAAPDFGVDLDELESYGPMT